MGLLPRDEKFWEFFKAQNNLVSEASEVLLGAAQSGYEQLVGAAVQIKTIERKSFRVMRDLQIKLQKTFVTPLDPEDISLLSENLDHLVDQVEAISYRLAVYRLEPLPPLMIDLASNVRKFAGYFDQAFLLLSEGKSTEGVCGQILDTEEQTGNLIREGTTKLFAEETDAILVMKKKEIYDIFERLSRSCQDLANTLQNVSVKNA